MDLSKLDLLESRVTTLITRLTESEKKNSFLEDEIKALQAQIDSLSTERVTILQKIDELLSRLDF
ncbi:MAG: hypothetical protein LBF22_05375 [Deltaproteobacteria bacterium]|jgi:uncharacterized coiled-coil DUF342 family protein|nr:hypothetical protein [Deltaproteobacteria bacterium]